MNLQKINFKLFTDSGENVDLDPFLDIFARWREDEHHAAGWVDLADYAHVVKGPGVMLIGQRGNLSFDLAHPGPGILYANREGLEGSPDDRIREAFRRSFELSTALLEEAEYPVSLVPRPGSWELSFNDRLETPNTESTHDKLEEAVKAVVEEFFGKNQYKLIRQLDSARRYGFLIQSGSVLEMSQLAERLQARTAR